MDIIEQINQALAVHPARIVEPVAGLNSAVALRQTQAGLHILFTERSTMKTTPWSGQISFPGERASAGMAG